MWRSRVFVCNWSCFHFKIDCYNYKDGKRYSMKMVTKREQGVVILKTKSVKRDTEVHFIMIKGPTDLEDKIRPRHLPYSKIYVY